jgi:hypothetical protein
MNRSAPDRWMAIGAILALAWVGTTAADSAKARCDIYPKGEDRATKMLGCTFSQRQGFITIAREDGVTHELSPVEGKPGSYRDQKGRDVRREDGMGDQGEIFRLADESVYVYWSTAGLDPTDADNLTAPFSTKDYDATALLRCRASAGAAFGACPAGVLRMDGGEASVVVQSPAGAQFTINFMKTYVNATNREADARLDGDTWTVTINGTEVYEVPLAFIQGG